MADPTDRHSYRDGRAEPPERWRRGTLPLPALQVARMQRIELEGYKGGNIWGVENPYAQSTRWGKAACPVDEELNQPANALDVAGCRWAVVR